MRRLSSLLITSSLLIAACGGSAPVESPVAPTGIGPAQNPAPGPPTISGGATVNGSVRFAATAPTLTAFNSNTTVNVVGTTIVAAVSPAGQFTLTGVPAGNVALKFTGPGVDATVSIGQVQVGETVNVLIAVKGSEAAVETSSKSNGRETQLEGRIESLPPTQPANTMIVGGHKVKVDGTTAIRHGSETKAFSDLEMGQRVHVKGQMSGDTLMATRIELQNLHTDLPVNINGVIDSLTGSELSFQFKIGSRAIKGDHETQFFGDGNTATGFSSLKNDARVEVQGLQRDGYVYAARLHIQKHESKTDTPTPDSSKPDKDHPNEVEGTVSGLGGVCPNLTLKVGTRSVTTNNKTAFKGGTCAALKNTDKVKVEGHPQSDGALLAREITKE
jgi:cytoskeletal protein CcmA (bactofilin family)